MDLGILEGCWVQGRGCFWWKCWIVGGRSMRIGLGMSRVVGMGCCGWGLGSVRGRCLAGGEDGLEIVTEEDGDEAEERKR